jgi:cytochrome c oxidase subunit 1
MSAVAAPGTVARPGAEAYTATDARVKSLVLRYILTSTALLLVAGALGAVLRQSQAKIDVLPKSTWYAVMTVHGLGAFVGWAAFAMMGISFWVLHECGFPMRRWGLTFAEACYWTMVAGVCGIVITCLSLSFGGSWVFLYPLPFHSVSVWSRLATGVFSFSVLLVGISIIVWCLGILAVITSRETHERGGSWGERLGSGLGFGLISPRFQTRREPVPYAVIPLTVIALDMIIATLPLAVLLVEMIAQSIHPSLSVSPLLAKNVLWWFGHPVVYLLLFPAVAVYYLLVPRYAGRPLVAGRIIVAAWIIGVTTNVIIGAHHMYLDYPSGSPQAAINTMVEPLTFAIVTPSALSLYSLALTVWRANVRWTVAMQFLFVGALSWLVAGIQGVINATISFDLVVHNTLWIVGHFHNMAILNIGLVIFAAVYAFLPTLTGREWYSERLGRWHLWLTTIGGYGMVVPWLVQGLEGAPRRWAALPGDRYDSLTKAALPFIAVLALGQLVFVYNLLRTLGAPWLRGVAADGPPVGMPERTELGGLIAGLGVGLGAVAVLYKPFTFGPIGVLLGLVGYHLGARRSGVCGVAVSLVGTVAGFALHAWAGLG